MEDGFRVFRELHASNRLKERLRITFIDQNGLEEPGVDGGGLYKGMRCARVQHCTMMD